jgi:hypothetical protein
VTGSQAQQDGTGGQKVWGMEIEKFLDCAYAPDGGSIQFRVLLKSGSEIILGIDGSIPKDKSDQRIVIEDPTGLAGMRTFPRDSEEDAEIVAAVDDLVKRNCGFLRMEALHEAEYNELNEIDAADKMAVDFLRALLER